MLRCTALNFGYKVVNLFARIAPKHTKSLILLRSSHYAGGSDVDAGAFLECARVYYPKGDLNVTSRVSLAAPVGGFGAMFCSANSSSIGTCSSFTLKKTE